MNFLPAMSAKARKAKGQQIRAWHLKRRSGTDLSGLAHPDRFNYCSPKRNYYSLQARFPEALELSRGWLVRSGQLGPDWGDLPALVVEPADQSLRIRPVVCFRFIGPELAQVIGNDGYWVTEGEAGRLVLRLVAHGHHHNSRPAIAPWRRPSDRWSLGRVRRALL